MEQVSDEEIDFLIRFYGDGQAKGAPHDARIEQCLRELQQLRETNREAISLLRLVKDMSWGQVDYRAAKEISDRIVVLLEKENAQK